jgi:Sensors of blue-light using FAD
VSLTRLVYFSKNKMPTDGSVAVQLKQILASAIKNNAHLAVTGGLVFNRNYFMQVLEGNRSTVTKLFTTISGDTRHDQIELMDVKDARERLFGAWSMGFASTPELIKELWAKIDVQGEFNPKLLTGDQIVKIIFELVKKEEGFASSRKFSVA